MDKVFRTPDQIKKEKTEHKVPVSARIPKSVYDRLVVAANKSELSISLLVGKILEDYDSWLASKKK